MAGALYDMGRGGLLDGSIDWGTNPIHLVLIDEGTEVPDLVLDDIAAGGSRRHKQGLHNQDGDQWRR